MRKALHSPCAFAAPAALLAAALMAAAPLAKADAADTTDPPPATTAVNPPEPAATDAPRLPAAAAAASGSALKFTLTNTLRYDAAIRLRAQSPALAGLSFDANQNDGDRAFNAGQIIDNRVDLLSEMDVAGKNFGARFSGSASYDGAYNATNSIGNGSSVNASSVPYNNFAAGTTNVDGRDTQLLDAFGYVNTSIGSTKLSVRAGQHALLWGETLFFGANGIAGGMAPINIITALSEPAAEFKEIVLPTTQVSAQLQLSSNMSVGGYYQTHWRRDLLPGVGSYFSNTDIYDVGGERLLIGPVTIPTPGGPITFANAAFQRSVDEYPQNGGQFGVQFRFRPPNTGLDLGAYFIQFSEKAGVPYLAPGRNAAPPTFGEYYFVYPQGIRSFGLSASKSVGDFNLAAETSVRTNQDLISNVPNVSVGSGPSAGAPLDCAGNIVPAPVVNNSNNPCYAVGKTLHANGSILWSLPANPISKEGSFVAEIAWQHLLGVTANPGLLDPFVTRNNSALQFVYTPTFRNVFKRTDLDVPISYQVGLQGVGAVVALPSGGVGDITAGLRATYDALTMFSLNYTHFTGPTGPFNDAQNVITRRQTLADRDFLSFSISRSF
jgi:hypothetical protein